MLSQIGKFQFIRHQATAMPPTPTIEPTDRSMPAVRITKDSPSAAMARMAMSRKLAFWLSTVMKLGLTTPPTIEQQNHDQDDHELLAPEEPRADSPMPAAR